jgi:hypothetical protein
MSKRLLNRFKVILLIEKEISKPSNYSYDGKCKKSAKINDKNLLTIKESGLN